MALGPAVPFTVLRHVFSEDFGKLYLIYRYMDLDLQIQSIMKPNLRSKTCRLCERITIISLVGTCNHLYCVQCWVVLIKNFDSKCFKCKKRFHGNALSRRPFTENAIGEIISRCPNYFWAGCTLSFKLKDLPRHIRACELTRSYRDARDNDMSSAFPSVVQLNFDEPQKIELTIDYINRFEKMVKQNFPETSFYTKGPSITFKVSPNGEFEYTVSVTPHYNFKTGKIGLKFRSNALFRQTIKAPFPTVTYVIKVPPIEVHKKEDGEMSDLAMYGLKEDYFIPMGEDKYIRVVERLFADNIILNLEDELHYVSYFDWRILTAIARTQKNDCIQIDVSIDPTPTERHRCNGAMTFEIEDYSANVKLMSKGFIQRMVSKHFFTSVSGYRVKAELVVDDSTSPRIQTLYVNILSGIFDDRLRRQNGFLVKVALQNAVNREKGGFIDVLAQVFYDNPIRVDLSEPLEEHLINSDLKIKLFVQELHNDKNHGPANYFLDFKNFDIKSWNVLIPV